MEKRYLCIDVGGTELKAAPVDGTGALLAQPRYFPAGSDQEAGPLLDHFTQVIRDTCPGQMDGVRMAFPGPFDYGNGICLLRGQDKYDKLYGVNLRQELSLRLDFPVEEIRFLNDADAFAMGEMGFGEAQGAARAMFICIGTGLGSGFGVDGHMALAGTPGMPENGELFNVPFLDKRLDDYLSRRGLMALAREYMGEALDGRELAARVEQGDQRARDCWSAFGRRVRDALLPWLESFQPETLCFGGQITRSGGLFLPPVEDACRDLGIRVYVTEDTSVRAMQGLTRI
ncbi:MAG: ROK family protein [Oscillospiraceae bacterium]|nr:ROK family protein [Oscillospiraceae bacterium]